MSAPTEPPSRLRARPSLEGERSGAVPAGLRRLGLAEGRDASLYVPAGFDLGRPAGLLVHLHGAGSSGPGGLSEALLTRADAEGMLVLAPDSRGGTWDVVSGSFGPDAAFIDAALERVFSVARVDPGRVIAAGFSDGASYALSLALSNGDLFSHVLAFSPGFLSPDAQIGRPGIFVSHGISDEVLRIEYCSRELVPLLEQIGYEVEYLEFTGGHEMPSEVLDRAFTWLGAHPHRPAGQVPPERLRDG